MHITGLLRVTKVVVGNEVGQYKLVSIDEGKLLDPQAYGGKGRWEGSKGGTWKGREVRGVKKLNIGERNIKRSLVTKIAEETRYENIVEFVFVVQGEIETGGNTVVGKQGTWQGRVKGA